MVKIIWMSDPHFQSKGCIDGLDPRTRLDAAIDHANLHYPDADFAILSGDLVGDDIAADYANIARHLSRSVLPIHPMMGNNDERAGLRKHLKLPANAMPDFIQYTIETPQSTIICLDTHKPDSHAGQFCQARRDWLEDVLQKTQDKQAYLFMHHPPLDLGLPMQDEIMLEDSDVFLDLIARHRNIKHLFMGHVHRATTGTVRGIPFATLGSLAFQAPTPRPDWNWDQFKAPEESPQYGVLNIKDGDVILQYTQFCAYDVGVRKTS